MVTAGVTGKSAPLALVPRDVPPEEVVYHLILFPVEVAFRFEVALMHTVVGFADTGVGTAGKPETVSVVVMVLTQLLPFVTV